MISIVCNVGSKIEKFLRPELEERLALNRVSLL